MMKCESFGGPEMQVFWRSLLANASGILLLSLASCHVPPSSSERSYSDAKPGEDSKTGAQKDQDVFSGNGPVVITGTNLNFDRAATVCSASNGTIDCLAGNREASAFIPATALPAGMTTSWRPISKGAEALNCSEAQNALQIHCAVPAGSRDLPLAFGLTIQFAGQTKVVASNSVTLDSPSGGSESYGLFIFNGIGLTDSRRGLDMACHGALTVINAGQNKLTAAGYTRARALIATAGDGDLGLKHFNGDASLVFPFNSYPTGVGDTGVSLKQFWGGESTGPNWVATEVNGQIVAGTVVTGLVVDASISGSISLKADLTTTCFDWQPSGGGTAPGDGTLGLHSSMYWLAGAGASNCNMSAKIYCLAMK